MVKGLLIGHRDLSIAIMHVLESVVGTIENIDFLSNEGLSTEDLTQKILLFSKKDIDDGIIIFVDMYGGSCWRAAKKTKLKNSYIISGYNIPMIMSFIHKRETLPFDVLIQTIENDGKRAVRTD